MTKPQPVRVAVQRVKKVANRQNAIISIEIDHQAEAQTVKEQNHIKKSVNACVAMHFDLLRKTNSTVPPYADEFVLLVLTTF